MKINLNLSAPENCPSFEICQFNKCPLHKDYEKLEVLESDRQLYNFHSCRCTKAKRMEIARAFNLKNKGLTKRQLHGLKLSLKMKEKYRDSINLPKIKDTLNLLRDLNPETLNQGHKKEVADGKSIINKTA